MKIIIIIIIIIVIIITISIIIIIIMIISFWSRGVTAFFDVKVTHVNSKCNQEKATSTIVKEQEEEKKRKYQQRVLEVEIGSFTPLVFGTNGGMGADCDCFLKRLAEKLSEKNEEPYHITIT